MDDEGLKFFGNEFSDCIIDWLCQSAVAKDSQQHVAEMMTTTTMMMPPPKKARHNFYSYLETDLPFINGSGGFVLGQDGFFRGATLQSSHGSQLPREIAADLQEFRALGPCPGSQPEAVVPQGQSPRTLFQPTQGISRNSGFSFDFHAVGPYSDTQQRISRSFDVEPPSLRVDTIELPRRTTMTTPSGGAEANDAPLDLSILSADNLRRTLDDQTPRRSETSPIPFQNRSSGANPPESVGIGGGGGGGQKSAEKSLTTQLPLFVNLENSRLESLQLGLQARRDHDTAETVNDETKVSDQTGWQPMTDCEEIDSDVEPSRKQKNAIDRLRAHLERRQEGRPVTSTAYASLSKHLAAIEATAGNRYEAGQGTMSGELKAAKTTRMRTSFRSTTEAETQGRIYTHFEPENVIPIGNPEASDQRNRCLSGLTIGGLHQRQLDHRVQEAEVGLQNVSHRDLEPYRDSEQRCAVTLGNESISWTNDHSARVAFERHPTSHSYTSGHSIRQAQSDIQLQDRILVSVASDLQQARLSTISVSNHTSGSIPMTRDGRHSRLQEPDSLSSHSLPDLFTRSDLYVSTQAQQSRRPASIDAGFPSSENLLTKSNAAGVAMDRVGNDGGRTHEACSPDQSTDCTNYNADNLPSIIAHARLDDDCEFASSFVDTPKEATIRGQHHPIEKSLNISFRNRRNTVRSGSVGTGKSSSPEPPSSTFEDEPVAEKTKDENNNTKATESAIPCKICQDVANGFHYGVWSCEGCKAFFKRSITGSAKYVCPADNNCTINRLRKKSCQACRLRKCYEYGMSPGNCRGENGSKIRKRKLQEADRKEDTKNLNGVNGDYRKMNGVSNRELPDNVHLPVQTANLDFHYQSTATDPVSGPVTILQHLLAVERPIRFADFVDVRTEMDAADSERIQLLTSIMKLVNLQLMDVVTWSRSLPGFNALNLHIRTHLLVSSWSEILLLTNAFYSLQCTNAIVIAPNLHLTKERCKVIGMMALFNRLMAIVKSFQQLALTHNEMLLMQALLLVNSDLTAPQLIPRLDGMRASLMRSWHQSCTGGQGQGQGQVDYDRISRLLMLLPHIRHCSLLFQRFLVDSKHDSRIPFNGFLQEVTDDGHEFDQMSILELLVEEDARL